MALYTYTKSVPRPVINKSKRKIGKSISLGFIILGFLVIAWVVYPIASFEITSHLKYNSALLSQFNLQKTISLSNVKVAKKATSDVLSSKTENNSLSIDYSQLHDWIPKKPQNKTDSNGRIYFLSIPKLNIKEAMVKISGDDLNKTLIHYGGTGLPGEYGTSVIFGHSILPAFYNPQNYKTIFSLLPKLDKGDEVFVKYDGITYRYTVSDMKVTSPDDISILEQKYDNSYISLITCVPPGTYWKRLLVRAILSPQGS